jgi:hypothetical protein
MKLHCIYCGSTLNVTRILHRDESPDIQAERLAFEQKHDRECGQKSVGMILDLEANPAGELPWGTGEPGTGGIR